jgi:hypothetical protein
VKDLLNSKVTDADDILIANEANLKHGVFAVDDDVRLKK